MQESLPLRLSGAGRVGRKLKRLDWLQELQVEKHKAEACFASFVHFLQCRALLQ